MLGDSREQQGDRLGSLQAWFQAVTRAQRAGQWVDQASTPTELLPSVVRAIEQVRVRRRELYFGAYEDLRREHGAPALSPRGSCPLGPPARVGWPADRPAPTATVLLFPRPAQPALSGSVHAAVGRDRAGGLPGDPRRSHRTVARGSATVRGLHSRAAGRSRGELPRRRRPGVGGVLLLPPWRALRRQPCALPNDEPGPRIDRALPYRRARTGNLLLDPANPARTCWRITASRTSAS